MGKILGSVTVTVRATRVAVETSAARVTVTIRTPAIDVEIAG